MRYGSPCPHSRLLSSSYSIYPTEVLPFAYTLTSTSLIQLVQKSIIPQEEGIYTSFQQFPHIPMPIIIHSALCVDEIVYQTVLRPPFRYCLLSCLLYALHAYHSSYIYKLELWYLEKY